ncbi:NADH:ubiquinone oxidoreductase subunit 39 isoform X2 [Brevipalpus obovatus]|uniref:NADH:ubiquinone oxidoreductase subunit 39 isoform X2 n=1 Tax=Brevipalpus obovatus TaxID=246614 RepID=UPI003D9F56BA
MFTRIVIAESQALGLVSIGSKRCYSSSLIPEIHVDTEGALPKAVKRGTGGRGSFNGHVVTVFGATGCLGHKLVPYLCSKGCQVIIPYRRDPLYSRELRVNGELGQILYMPYYLRDPEAIFRACKYSNSVINLVGDFHDNPFTLEDANFEGARLIAKMAKMAGVRKFIHVSCLNASANPEPVILRKGSRYLKAKYAGEQAVRDVYPDATIFRPARMFGAYDRYFMMIWNRFNRINYDWMLWNMGRGIYKMPVYQDNVAEGIMKVLLNDKMQGGLTIDCIGPRRYELHDLHTYFNKILDAEGPRWPAIRDLKLSPHVWLWWIWRRLDRQDFPMRWEFIEYEHVTDRTTRNNPTLEDLGINLVKVEDRAFTFMRKRARAAWVPESFEEFKMPEEPPHEVVH